MKNYTQLTATTAFPLSPITQFGAAGDFDGDGRQEILVQDVITTVPSISSVSYFNYSDLSDNWNQPSLAVTASAAGVLSGNGQTVGLFGYEPQWSADFDGEPGRDDSDEFRLSVLVRSTESSAGIQLEPAGAPYILFPGDRLQRAKLIGSNGAPCEMVFINRPLEKLFLLLEWERFRILSSLEPVLGDLPSHREGTLLWRRHRGRRLFGGRARSAGLDGERV